MKSKILNFDTKFKKFSTAFFYDIFGSSTLNAHRIFRAMNLEYDMLVKSCSFRGKNSPISVHKATKNSSNHKRLQGNTKSKDEIRRNIPTISELSCTEMFNEISKSFEAFL